MTMAAMAVQNVTMRMPQFCFCFFFFGLNRMYMTECSTQGWGI